MKTYLGQTNLTLYLNTGTNLTDVQTALIKYIKPDKTEGFWTGTVSDLSIYYQFNSTDIDIAGDWIVWAYITFNSGKISIGEPTTLKCYKQGT